MNQLPTLCFITPPSGFLLDSRVFPALGVLKVAAVMEDLGYPVEHLDLNGVSHYQDLVVEHCARTTARIFGITATTPQIPAAIRIASTIRDALPDAKLILGGPHCTLVHAAGRRDARGKTGRSAAAWEQLRQHFDILVAGDGEKAIRTAVNWLEPAVWRSIASYPVTIDADNPEYTLFLNAKEVDQMPFPSRHLIDLDSYHYAIDGKRTTSLIAQLGCPFGCAFCAGRSSPMLRRVRLRTTASVIEEIEHLVSEYGYHGFMFLDDELNVNPNMIELMIELCRMQDQLGVEFRMRGFIKAELFTDEQAEWMHRAGFRKILCGFESGSERVLTNINKKATRADNSRAMDLAHKHGLGMKALMSLGHPGESDRTIRETSDWLLSVAPDDFDVTIITAYPGSPYYDDAELLSEFRGIWMFKAKATGDRLYMKDINYAKTEDFYKGIPGEYKSYVWTDHLADEDLVRAREWLESSVRAALDIPYNQSGQSIEFESSYGASLPKNVLRKSNSAGQS